MRRDGEKHWCSSPPAHWQDIKEGRLILMSFPGSCHRSWNEFFPCHPPPRELLSGDINCSSAQLGIIKEKSRGDIISHRRRMVARAPRDVMKRWEADGSASKYAYIQMNAKLNPGANSQAASWVQTPLFRNDRNLSCFIIHVPWVRLWMHRSKSRFGKIFGLSGEMCLMKGKPEH